MDRASARQERIKTQLARRQPGERSLVLRGLTSVLMEGRRCPLPTFGYSRDGKKEASCRSSSASCATGRAGRLPWRCSRTTPPTPTSVATAARAAADPVWPRTGHSGRRQRHAHRGTDTRGSSPRRARLDQRPVGARDPSLGPRTAPLQPSLFDDRDIAQVTCKELYSGERPSMGEVLRTKRRPSAPARIRRDAGRRPGRSGRHCRP